MDNHKLEDKEIGGTETRLSSIIVGSDFSYTRTYEVIFKNDDKVRITCKGLKELDKKFVTYCSDKGLGEKDVEEVEYIKPECELIGKNGNIYNLIALTRKALNEEQLSDEADELLQRILHNNEAHSYEEALCIIMDYVNVV